MIPNPLEEFRTVVMSKFSLTFLTLEADGEVHRFHVPGDRAGTKNGWYKLYPDGAYGCFGTWKAPEENNSWKGRTSRDFADTNGLRVRAEQSLRETERLQRQHAAAAQATQIWHEAAPADPGHPYLVAKGVLPYSVRQQGSILLVPLYHNRQLVNLQRIYLDGTKRFLSGGRVVGCYSPIGKLVTGLPIYVCEGWATGATLHEETGAPVACAVNCGNLLQAAQEVCRHNPGVILIIAGDDDRQTKGNPGRVAATKAAALLGCGLVFPAWPEEAPEKLTDFNDLVLWQKGRS